MAFYFQTSKKHSTLQTIRFFYPNQNATELEELLCTYFNLIFMKGNKYVNFNIQCRGPNILHAVFLKDRTLVHYFFSYIQKSPKRTIQKTAFHIVELHLGTVFLQKFLINMINNPLILSNLCLIIITVIFIEKSFDNLYIINCIAIFKCIYI